MHPAQLLGTLFLGGPKVTLPCDALAADAAAALAETDARALLLLDEGRPVGVLSPGAVLRALSADPAGRVAAFAAGPPAMVSGTPTLREARAAAASSGTPWVLWERDGEPGWLFRVDELPDAPVPFEAASAVHVAFDRASDLMGVVDDRGHLVEVNAAALRLVGLGHEAALSRAFEELPWWTHDPAQRRRLVASLARAFEGHPESFEATHVDVHGAQHAMVVSLQPLPAADGRVPLVFVHGRDVTEQRWAEREALRFRQAVEQSPVSIVITRTDGAIEYVNPRFTEITGHSRAEALGKNPRIVQSGNTPHAVYEEMWATIVAGGEWSGALENRRKDGRLYWEQVRIAPVRGEDGVIDGFVAVKEDVTRQRELEARTRMLASVFENARDGLFVTTPEGLVAEVNDGFAELTGLPRAELVGLHVSRMGDAGSELESAAFAAALVDAGGWKGDRTFTRPSGEVVTAQVSVTAVRDPAGVRTHFVGICTDVTPLKDEERRLAAKARTDALTGLSNRVGLMEDLECALARRRRAGGAGSAGSAGSAASAGTLVAVGLLDLDGFKAINDRFGHEAGDALLREAGRRLSANLRKNDTVARLGGDEFVLVLEGLRAASDVDDWAARLVQSLARPFSIGSHVCAISGSLGLAFAPTHGEGSSELLAAADRAMYAAKALGGGCWCSASPAKCGPAPAPDAPAR